MNAVHIVLVATGAVLGALMRWQVGVWFNPILPGIALGTLLVNVVGCFLSGIVLSFALEDKTLLFLTTGFLGSFTTFSALSSEVVTHLFAHRYSSAAFLLLAHLVLGIAATISGFVLVRWFNRAVV